MADRIQLIPYVRSLVGDVDTPVSVYLKLNEPESFILESVTGGEQVARYSFVGFDPFERVIVQDGEDPVAKVKSVVDRYAMDDYPELPPFIGGAVGYFAWETIRYIESIPDTGKPKSKYPLAHFVFPRSMVVFDHATRKLILVTLGTSEESDVAEKRLDAIESKLNQTLDIGRVSVSDSDDPFSKVMSNYEEGDFKSHVSRVKDYIYEGDVFQLVLSQRFQLEQKLPSFDIYRRLRVINPSPYMFYFNFPGYDIIGSSPEILVKLQDGRASVRPIAGTRPRIQGKEEELVKDLLSDEKELAEHIMLVDLGRNDLGRVCDYSSIETSDLLSVEYYSHVLHIVSHVDGVLKSGQDAFDLFRATFPAGTLSGAPKVRALEIIEELEPEERGLYGGALGYIDFRGNMDLCIVIRTILARDGQLSIQAGAGLVADSDPDKEFEECQNKARGMIQACL